MGKPSILSPFRAIKYLFQKPVTLRYPFEKKEPAPRYRGFHLNDWEQCTGCGNCADICPNEAITMIDVPEIEPDPDSGEKGERPQLDYGRCCFCGLCVDICPPGSLRLSRDYLHIHFDTDTFTFVPQDDKKDCETFLPAEEYSILKASLTHRRRDYEGFSSDLDYALFEPERVPMAELPAEERKSSFIEQVIGYSTEEAIEEAARCLECELCEAACPANLKIADYVKAIYEGDSARALRTIFEDNPLPAICGRICMKHCEDACSLGLRGEPVAIRWLKRFASDSVQDYRETLGIQPGPATGKSIAVIGAGAGGLALAYHLRLKGHDVTVFDSLDAGGGMLRIGPPRYRLPEEALDRDVDFIASLGVEFHFNTTVGKDVQFDELLQDYDAVFIGVGLGVSRTARIENEDRAIMALDFLEQSKLDTRPEVGRQIIVIGGGNVAMDVARTCVRLQEAQYPGEETSTKTVCLESWDEMPATEEEIKESKEEGIQINPAWGPKAIILEDGEVKGLDCKAVKSVFDEDGRFSPTFYEDKTMVLEGDMVIEAIGQGYDLSFIPDELSLEFTERRKVKVDENGMTSIEGVFAGGDIVNVNMDAVTAIADAKRAAEGIHKMLSQH
ncbi:MAG: FAD-dependent oxidoreductase [Planctomycetes bacterium]|nr:FAD-dependent oxidoreductase [Planctomycetota bacterium]